MENSQQTPHEQQPQFSIQRIYVKDLSFEAPGVPEIFKGEWNPEINIDLNTHSKSLEAGVYEVQLNITVTAKNSEKTAFLVEVKHAGIFTIQGIPEEQLGHMLGSYCPSILFPYAREVIAEMINRGSFPQFHIAPINFDALYAQYLEENAKAEKAEAPVTTH